MANTLTAMYSILDSDAAVAALLDDSEGNIKLSPMITRQGVQPPFAIHKIQDSDPTNQKDGVSPLDTDRYIIAFFSETETEKDSIRAAIRTAIDRYTGTQDGVQIDKVIYENKQDFYDEDAELFWGEDDYRIRIKL